MTFLILFNSFHREILFLYFPISCQRDSSLHLNLLYPLNLPVFLNILWYFIPHLSSIMYNYIPSIDWKLYETRFTRVRQKIFQTKRSIEYLRREGAPRYTELFIGAGNTRSSRLMNCTHFSTYDLLINNKWESNVMGPSHGMYLN